MTVQAPNIDAILERVQKMLNVTGRTPEEAAAYVEKAHAILAEYDLSIEDVGQLKADPRTSVAKSDAVASVARGKTDGWKADVLRAVAESFECRVMTSWATEQTKSGRTRVVTHYHLVGFKHDLEAARYAHSFLVGEITRLAKEYSRPMWDDIKALAKTYGMSVHDAESDYALSEGTHPLKAEVYFIKGATQTISYSLVQEAKARTEQDAATNPHGLVVQKAGAVEDFLGRERYGDKWPEAKARREAMAKEQQERWAAGSALAEAMKATEKPETPAQRRKREAKERRDYERWERAYYREQAKIDHRAMSAGQDAGRNIKIRRGIGSAADKEAIGG